MIEFIKRRLLINLKLPNEKASVLAQKLIIGADCLYDLHRAAKKLGHEITFFEALDTVSEAINTFDTILST